MSKKKTNLEKELTRDDKLKFQALELANRREVKKIYTLLEHAKIIYEWLRGGQCQKK